MLCICCFFTLDFGTAKCYCVYIKNTCRHLSGRKELIMANINISNLNLKSVMGFYFYTYFKACFFAGLFCRATKPSLSGS